MLSEEEKTHIIEKLRFENEIRQKLSGPAEPKKSPWLNSPISLLIIGSIISGFLVPWFQLTHKTIEWRRQNQFDNVNFQLGMMRDCLKEFVYLSAYSQEALDRVQPFMQLATPTRKDHEEFEQQYVELQNRRYRQNAKVSSLVIYFRDEDIRKQFKDYLERCTNYLRDLKRFVKTKYCISNSEACKKTDTNKDYLDKYWLVVQSYIVELNSSYELVSRKMKEDIGRIENERQKWL
jgi:hypothetical protein